MKTALLTLLLLLAAPVAGAQYVSFGAGSGTAPTCSVTVTNSNIGDTYLLATFTSNSTAISSVVDQLGNAVSPVSGVPPTTWGSGFVERLYSGTNKMGGTLTLKVTLAASVYNECYGYDYVGMAIDSVAAPKVTPTAAAATSNAVTTTGSDLLFAYVHSDGGVTNTPGTGFTGRPGPNPNAEDKAVTAPGSYTASMSFSATANSVSFLIAFKTPPPSAHSVSLSWVQGVNPVGACPISGNGIYRGTASGSEVQIASITPSTAYVDAAVVSGAHYFYEVTASNCNGESNRSSEVSVTIPAGSLVPNAPTGLSGVAQ